MELLVDNSTNNSSSNTNKILLFGKGKYSYHGPKKKAATLSIKSGQKEILMAQRNPVRGAGGLFPCKRLMGMCCWMGSHFHDWIDNNGVALSTELLEWGRTFWDFWSEKASYVRLANLPV